MKKKRNTTSRLRDIIAILICLTIATYSLWLFWNDFNAVMSKNNEHPIATVSWKYRAAQRKFSDRLLWDRLQQDSPVYNGDTIRTAAGAETTVTFANSELHLGENTIIQIQMDDTGTTSVNLTDGSLSANSNAGSKMQLKSGNVMVELQEGSSLNAQAGKSDTEALSLQVIEGNVVINGAEGSRSILQGESMSIDQNGTVGNTRPVTILEPAPNLQLLKFEGNTLPLQFSWKLATLPQNSQLVFETATDKNFSQIQEQIGLSGLNSMKINFTEGIHYWRFYVTIDGIPLEKSQETGRINILHA
ncbi:MAG: FecR domain-containing protein, partial [Spirochaetaceae bacterium]|nr:FecR domain-containing protein [Spirochaetaceae bacterium]